MTPDQLAALMLWTAKVANHRNQHVDKIDVFRVFGFSEGPDGYPIKAHTFTDGGHMWQVCPCKTCVDYRIQYEIPAIDAAPKTNED